ncbi:MAG TPA: NAD(P)H-dependent glycerol-3-phosphate dehydrogenase [Candidatus Limnocylindrales bacterium]|jgi:glycerol-3-phosphate dehydrogenase (NAD(P)+)
MARPNVAVVGAGAWGTTLALQLARTGPVTLLVRDVAAATALTDAHENVRHLPGVRLPVEVEASADPADLVDADRLVIVAVPSSGVRSTAERIGAHLHPATVVVSVAKGLERGSLKRMTEVLAEALPIAESRLAALSGPNLAHEIASGLPASAVVASTELTSAQRVLEVLGSRSFRLYTNRDVIGVELCGALKNIVAIAAGAAEQLGFGDNGKASLITRGLAEMTRLGVAAGANPLTFAGLAGVGDVVATCSSPRSRNHRLGEELARGRSWADIEADLPGVAEGAYTVDAALGLAERLGVELPIAQEVHNALFEGKSVQRCLIDLLSRESKDELAGLEGRPGPAAVA